MATVVVQAGRPPRRPDGPVNPDITMSSTYHAGGEIGYARTSNPTWMALEDAVGTLEGGRALAFASGMAAVNAVLELIPVGGTVVAPSHTYSGTRARLAELAGAGRLTVREVAVDDPAEISAACPGADLLWLESPTNPTMAICDLAAAARAAHAAGALVACDSTFATPMVQRPLEHGCDIVVHSATKALAGHSDVLLGMVVTAGDDLHSRLWRIRTLTGAIPGPVEAWLALRGLRTLALRMERAQSNAGELAQRLQAHPAVTLVRYPGLPGDPGHAVAARQMTGFGSLLSFQTIGTAADAQAVCERTELWLHATSLGGVESSLERRRRWPEENVEVPETLIRLSVGIEDVEDLWDDLDAALRTVVPAAH
ncbi:MAG: aminotransferase class I/II-fold pyridoxal phosphate-dependent enzyme [Candidatus Nanopelagicales bacterium]